MYQNQCSRAMARIRGDRQTPTLEGQAQLLQREDGVLVTVWVTGLPEGKGNGFFALHIHEGTDCGGQDFARTGGHYSAAPKFHPLHNGDLPPLLNSGGRAYLSVLTNRFTVADVVGRTLVIHSGADDFRSQPAGNAGVKIACGEIRCVERGRG